MANKYANILNNCACYSGISFSFLLAKESGLFDALMNTTTPLTSTEIGKIANIKERYAREMLGTLTSVELVSIGSNKSGENVYHLEPAAKQTLRENDFALAEMNYLRIFMSRYDDVKENVAADKKGKVRYDTNFISLIDEHKIKLAPATIEDLLKKVPGLKEKLERGIDCIEYGCGNAYHFSLLATRFPNSNFTATDISDEFLEPIKKRYTHIPNLKFGVVDLNHGSALFNQKKYDWIYVNDVIHDLPHPGDSIKKMKEALKKPDGVFTYIDFAGSGSQLKDVGNLGASFVYTCGTFVCIPESYQVEDSEAHGASIGKETNLNFARAAGLDVSVVTTVEGHGLYIAKHK